MSGYVDLRHNIIEFNYLLEIHKQNDIGLNSLNLIIPDLNEYDKLKKNIEIKRKIFKVYRDELDGCYDYIKVQLLDLYSNEKIDYLENLLNKHEDYINKIRYYYNIAKRSVKIIERNWIKCKYDPDYLLCKKIIEERYNEFINL